MRRQLSKSEVKDLKILLSKYNLVIDKKTRLEIQDDFIFIDGEICFFQVEDPVPTLKYEIKHNMLKRIVVDMGAVKFVASGADVMRPGIRSIDENIKKDDIIAIVDEKNNKQLAIGRSLFDAAEMSQMSSGKVIKNLHHVGDEIWKK